MFVHSRKNSDVFQVKSLFWLFIKFLCVISTNGISFHWTLCVAFFTCDHFTLRVTFGERLSTQVMIRKVNVWQSILKIEINSSYSYALSRFYRHCGAEIVFMWKGYNIPIRIFCPFSFHLHSDRSGIVWKFAFKSPISSFLWFNQHVYIEFLFQNLFNPQIIIHFWQLNNLNLS